VPCESTMRAVHVVWHLVVGIIHSAMSQWMCSSRHCINTYSSPTASSLHSVCTLVRCLQFSCTAFRPVCRVHSCTSSWLPRNVLDELDTYYQLQVQTNEAVISQYSTQTDHHIYHSKITAKYVKPRLHQIHVAVYMYPKRATCNRLHVSISVLLVDTTSAYM